MMDAEQMVRIRSEADVFAAVNTVREMAASIGMNQGATAAVATAVSELVTNVIKYARSGRVTVRSRRQRHRPGVEVVVEDRGPGIADIDRALSDHVSTGGTLGLGLPGARRLVDEFEIRSVVDEGTFVRMVKWG